LGRDITQVIEQPGNDPIVGRGPGDVRKQNADPLAGFNPLSQWASANGIIQSRHHGGAFILKSGRVRRLNNRRALVGQFHRQLTPAISKLHSHCQQLT